MFDEVICAAVRTSEQPTIDGRALLQLARLLDSVQESLRTVDDDNTTRFQTKSKITSTSAAVATGPAVGIRRTKSTHPGQQSGQVRSVAPRTTGERGSSGKIQPRRK